MKKLILSFAIIASCLRLNAEPFTACSVARDGSSHKISFTVKSEANIRYYLVEAGRDSINYEILSRIAAKGNTTLPQRYIACSYDTDYRYYRIRQVNMTAGGAYSPCMHLEEERRPAPVNPTPVSGTSLTYTSVSGR